MKNIDKSIAYERLFYFGPFCLNATERSLVKNDGPVPLTGKAFDLLLLLVESDGHLKTRDDLIKTLWPNTIVTENSLNWYISVLRKTLNDKEKGRHYIETMHRHGYRFTALVRVERVAIEPPEEDAEDVGAALAAIPSNANPIATKVAPTRRRTFLSALAGVAIVVIACVLVWRFALHDLAGKGAADAPAIAVLPFKNLSADSANAYFAAGIQDTILSKLAGIGKLRVVSRTSTERYPPHPANLKQVAAQLGVTAVIEGSVQKAGDRVLINVQLIDSRSNNHIWAQTYTRKLADVFAVENDVATQVAAALQAKLLPAEAARLASAPTHDPQAYLLFLKANYYANQVLDSSNAKDSVAAVARAVTLYHQAIVLDPRFPLAYARLSLIESYAYQSNIAHTSKIIDDAEHAARQTLALESSLPEAHLAMGYVKYYGHQNFSGALDQFKQIRESFRSNNADVIGAIAFVHRRQGKWQEALAGLRRASKLDPRNPRWFYEIGFTLGTLRHYPQAIQEFDRALALEPRDYNAATFKIITLLASGKPLEQARRLLRDIPNGSSQKGLIPALYFEVAQLSRQPATALEALKDAPDWLAAPNAFGREPTVLLRAQTWTAQGDMFRARQAYEKARDIIKTALQVRPKNSSLWGFLGMSEAGLGQKSKAIRAGLKAAHLTPSSKDAVSGPSLLVTLAKIYTQVGLPKQAIELLRQVLAMPAGVFISVPLLRRDPIWDSLRKNPEFQALLKNTAVNRHHQQAAIPPTLEDPLVGPHKRNIAGNDPTTSSQPTSRNSFLTRYGLSQYDYKRD